MRKKCDDLQLALLMSISEIINIQQPGKHTIKTCSHEIYLFLKLFYFYKFVVKFREF